VNPKAMKRRASYLLIMRPTNGRRRMTVIPPGESTIPACCAEYPIHTWRYCGSSTVEP